MSYIKIAAVFTLAAAWLYHASRKSSSPALKSSGSDLLQDQRMIRRGTRGRLRRIRRNRGMFTNLTIEADNLSELGLRSDRSLMDVKRRLRQIAHSSGLEIYNEDLTCVKIKPEDLTVAQVEHAVASAVDLLLDKEHLYDREKEYNSRHEIMIRSREMAVSGRVLGPMDRFRLGITIWWSSLTGRPLQRTVE